MAQSLTRVSSCSISPPSLLRCLANFYHYAAVTDRPFSCNNLSWLSTTRPFSSGISNPMDRKALKQLNEKHRYYDVQAVGGESIHKLPYSIRVLLESAVRNCDGISIKPADVDVILDWSNACKQKKEIPFKPARVLLQDFTGVPAVVDLAAMRDAMSRLGGDPAKINPLVPVDLVVDHSVQVDFSRSPEALDKNQSIEMERNRERFAFLKWGATAFNNMTIIPPGSGIVHQVNLEYLARVVFADASGLVYPDSLVGTDSHTTMIDGLGVVGWGVGGIEAEAVMLGQALSMVLPEVIGFELTGELPDVITATDLVLTITQILRAKGVVGKFVEFYGPGLVNLSLADRATIANMSPEYGATMGYFPVDAQSIKYLHQTGRSAEKIGLIESYLRKNCLFNDPESKSPCQIQFTDTLSLDLSTVEPSLSGPKRPHDRVALRDMKADFKACLTAPLGFKGYALPEKDVNRKVTFTFQGQEFALGNGSVVIASITSCTNTSNPGVMLAAGMLAKKAVEKGLMVKPFIKTSLSPGSKAVSEYYRLSGLSSYLEKLGFFHAGYGCMTCIGNSGNLDSEVSEAIAQQDLIVAAVLSGNRNFEGRVHPQTRANYLASPPLVVAYALAGRVDIDFDKEPVGCSTQGQLVYLRDIWPTHQEIADMEESVIKGSLFTSIYESITTGTDAWRKLPTVASQIYPWDTSSTYIKEPPFFKAMTVDPFPVENVRKARCLLNLGDSITTDHISPAGNIAKGSPAARYLLNRGVCKEDFNTYGARRGNDDVMLRGTFANIRIVNKMAPEAGPHTVHVPTGEVMAVSDVAERYRKEDIPMVVLAGKEYGSGSSRDWAAKGPYLMGVRAIVAESFERIHRTNLVGLGILPLEFAEGENADSLKLDGSEEFDVEINADTIKPGCSINVKTNTGISFVAKCRIDTDVEVNYFKNGGILPYVLRKIMKDTKQSK
eukprot:GHVS01023512.1.p1 GENE.GHVS01023512.1~~GHVS01023512.1.p1  ORF type:complete len:950 (-),score=97.16 GHVS01023512.1:130-2979(-)